MSKYVGDIITDVRRDTQHADDIPSASSTVGIQTDDILRYINNAQTRIVNLITKVRPGLFETVAEITTTAGTSTYTIPDNVNLGTRIRRVRFSSSGDPALYSAIYPTGRGVDASGSGYPFTYYRRDGSIVLVPTPNSSNSKLEVTYERLPDRLDLRRGQITDSIVSGGGVLTELTIDTATDDADALLSTRAQWLCVSDEFGNVTAYNIPSQLTYNSTTGEFNLPPHQLATGETISADSYVTIGRYTTTHFKLDESVERYLHEYAVRRINRREASDVQKWIDEELKELESEIVSAYSMADTMPKPFPIVDHEILYVDFD